jgi:hypothetical protein
MTVKLELPPDVQAGLLAQAQDSGLSLEAYLEQMLLRQSKARPTLQPDAPNQEKARAFREWARNHPHTPPLPDEALRRENLVRDVR